MLKDMLKPLYRFVSPRFQSLFLEYRVDFRPRFGHGQPAHPQLHEIIDRHRSEYEALLESFLTHAPEIQQIRTCEANTDPKAPCWNNGFLPGLDIVALYSLLPHFKPATYLEVGSGNSTKVAAKSIEDHQLPTRIISIDPVPRVEMDELADEVIRRPLENTDLDVFQRLQKNDILFIDNSHRVLPNSDATVFFLEILPLLESGVVVHIHDIYLPYDYPPFMCERFYSEQYVLAAFLLANAEKYRPLLPNYFISEDPGLAATIAPIWEHPNLKAVERHGGSFWLQIQ